MKFLKENWFKLIVSLVILIAGVSISYYYTFSLPSLQKKQVRLATDNNNPGLLKNSSGKLLTFNSPDDGYLALLNYLQEIIYNKSPSGLTSHSNLCDYSKLYASISGINDADQYCLNLANQLHMSPDTTLGSLQSKIGDLANAIANNNGFNNR